MGITNLAPTEDKEAQEQNKAIFPSGHADIKRLRLS
jgi:hypothetical protein